MAWGVADAIAEGRWVQAGSGFDGFRQSKVPVKRENREFAALFEPRPSS